MKKPANKRPPLQAGRWSVPLVCLLLAALTFAVFGQTMGFGFIDFDDNLYVYYNPMVVHGLSLKGLAWAFSFQVFNWHPLTWVSHMLDCQLYGLAPGGHHLTSVLLHTTTVAALFLTFNRMTGAMWRSAFVAAVFAIHPLRAESVAWVSERKDVLSGLFFVLTIAAYARYARSPFSFGRYGLALLLFALGLMSKPMLVTLPIILLLLDYWPLKRTKPLSKLVIEKLPFFALSILAGVATLFAQRAAMQSQGTFSFSHRLGNALVSGMVYVWQMVWPRDLALFYPTPREGDPWAEVALAGLFLTGMTVLAWRERYRRPWLAMGWGWYLIMLLPVVGIIQVGTQSHADRYTYLPEIGLAVIVTWWAMEWMRSRAVMGGTAAAILVVLSVAGWKQTSYWKNRETLWTRALACTTETDIAHYSLGDVMLDKGRIDDALAQYQIALRINPKCTEALLNMGTALRKKGMPQESLACYEQVLQIQPDFAEAHANFGVALRELGRVDDAVAQFERAIQLKPDYAEAHFNLGNAYLNMRKADEAIAEFQAALNINRDYEKARNNLGAAFLQKHLFNQAIDQFQRALNLQPDDSEALNNLAWVLAVAPGPLRDGNKALELSRRANELTGETNAMFLRTLAAAFATTGEYGRAASTAEAASASARTAHQPELERRLNEELEAYKAQHPFYRP